MCNYWRANYAQIIQAANMPNSTQKSKRQRTEKPSALAVYLKRERAAAKERRKLKKQLHRLNLKTDRVLQRFSEAQLLRLVQQLDFECCTLLQQCSRAWYIVFNHPDFALWSKLGSLAYSGRFTYLETAKCKLHPATRFYLNQWGASHCTECGMHAGRSPATISAFAVQGNRYHCINPSCGKELDGCIGTLQRCDIFNRCLASSKGKEKAHNWRELEQSLYTPNGEAMHTDFRYCARCGVLQVTEDYRDNDYCNYCLHSQENCTKYAKKYRQWLEYRQYKSAAPGSDERILYEKYRRYRQLKTCQKCSQCGAMPSECACENCSECQLCVGCKLCTDSEKLCQCVFCKDCDKVISANPDTALQLAFCECEDAVIY